MIEFEKPTISTVEESNNYGKFVVEPLERGYGTTLGNSLRRVLLSSLPGAAINAVQIDGVQHEFSTVDGVSEDVTQIILNLKKVALRIESDEVKELTVDFTGAGTLTAGDIQGDADVTILNPEMPIATVASGKSVKMTLTASRGRGYDSAENNENNQELGTGFLAIDSIYTPIMKVNYAVDNTRIGNRDDYDKLTIEVWTNGALTPTEAVSLAAQTLIGHLNSIVELSELGQQAEVMVSPEEIQEVEVKSEPIEDLELSSRAFNCLKRAGIHSINDLTNRTYTEMGNVRNLGHKSLEEIVSKLSERGLTLKSED